MRRRQAYAIKKEVNDLSKAVIDFAKERILDDVLSEVKPIEVKRRGRPPGRKNGDTSRPQSKNS